MEKDFVPEYRKINAIDYPQPTHPQSEYREEINNLVDMGSSEDHALTAVRLSDRTIIGTISVA